MKKVTFYHAGCPVCVSAEEQLLGLIDQAKVVLEIIHLGQRPSEIPKAEGAGVKPVPAILLENGTVMHINYGAGIQEISS
ncbi:MAG: thioredoxin family protein [Flavobacteriaceae bacterium]